MEAKETIYEGITFRSRLEATWAAMFDIMGWEWLYEPVTFSGYIPDFKIMGSAQDWFVEVKPLSVWRRDEATFLAKARGARKDLPLLVLCDEFWDSSADPGYAIGLIYDDEGSDEARLHEAERFDFLRSWGSWALCLSGEYDGNSLAESGLMSRAEVSKLWSRALNKTRWVPHV